MAFAKGIAPPSLVPENYEMWKKEMILWEMSTNLDKKKRAPTIFLTLEGKAREAILEMDPNLLNKDDGMEQLYAKLDTLFQEDTTQSALAAYDKFEKYIRPSEMSITDYLIEFERMTAKLIVHKITLPEPVLAYRALRSANLSDENEKLIRATVTNLTFTDMATQLKKVMLNMSSSVNNGQGSVGVQVKKESVAFTEDNEANLPLSENEEVYYGHWSGRRGRDSLRRSRFRGRTRRSRGSRFTYVGRANKKTNPLRPDGKPSTCSVCGSIYHWVRECPDKEEEQTTEEKEAYIVLDSGDGDPYSVSEEIILMAQAGDNSVGLLGETIGHMVLDSGTTSTVGGLSWYKCFLDTLSDEVKGKIKTQEGKKTFKFGVGHRLQSLKKVVLPCVIGGIRVDVNADIVDADIPLLLSKEAMKKAKSVLNFNDDSVNILGKKLKLITTSSGHYAIPIAKCLLEDTKTTQVLFIKELHRKSYEEKVKLATKLHKQFSHPSGQKMCKLAKDSGIIDKQFLNILNEFPSQCDVCRKYKKACPKPIVGFPLANTFNEVVAMDLKEIKGHKVLHLIDHATRYSVAVKVPNKEANTIISAIFKHWISYFGSPKSFLSDNGREFDNHLFRDLCQNLNIIVRTTAAQSPWSNGLNERHNGILGESVHKTLEEVGCSLEVALGWAVAAKNSLSNVGGYSPNQLVFGKNPNFPCVLTDQPPALEAISSSEMIASNLNAMHAARKSFIASESSEKLRRALRHQIRGSIGHEYSTGDMVYYKRNESDRWLCPGTVIGSEAK